MLHTKRMYVRSLAIASQSVSNTHTVGRVRVPPRPSAEYYTALVYLESNHDTSRSQAPLCSDIFKVNSCSARASACSRKEWFGQRADGLTFSCRLTLDPRAHRPPGQSEEADTGKLPFFLSLSHSPPMCVCVYACMYVCMYVCAYTRTHT